MARKNKSDDQDGDYPADYSVSAKWHDASTGESHTTHIVLGQDEISIAHGKATLEARIASEQGTRAKDIVVDDTTIQRIDQ